MVEGRDRRSERAPADRSTGASDDRRPRYRCAVDDFYVEELALFELESSGEHRYYWIEKAGLTTEQVAKSLSRTLGVRLRDVGYAGRKDRWARTRQWFSVRCSQEDDSQVGGDEGFEVLEAAFGSRKLRLGDLEGNRFAIRIRDVTPAEWEVVAERLERLRRFGFANRFGRQRFGHDGDNAEAGLDILRGTSRVKDRRRARFLVAALQAELFNRVLALREENVAEDSGGRRAIDQVLDGDLLVARATGFCVRAGDLVEHQGLVDALELSPSGPLFGAKMMRPGGVMKRLEALALEELELDESSFRQLAGRVDVSGERRSLRCEVRGLQGRHEEAVATSAEGCGDVVLEFELPPGSYATVLLEEAFAGLGLEEARGGTAKEGARKRS